MTEQDVICLKESNLFGRARWLDPKYENKIDLYTKMNRI